MIAEKVATLPKGSNQHAKNLACSIDNVAEKFNVSDESIRQARKVRTDAIPEVADAVESGKLPISLAATLADPQSYHRNFAETIEAASPPCRWVQRGVLLGGGN